MAAKKDPSNALPLTIENEESPSATITYANDVVAIIAGLAANEVEGIAGMCNVSGNLLSKNRNVTRGVKVEIGTEEVAVDLYVIIEYGTPIQRAALDAQESVRKAIESMTGLHVVRVDVHVQSVSFEKENKALQAGAASAALEPGEFSRDSDILKEPDESASVTDSKKADPPAAEKENVTEFAEETKEKAAADNASDVSEKEDSADQNETEKE